MIESLLYPKKLTESPQLLVDLETLFYKDGPLNTSLVGFTFVSSMNKDVNYRLISVGTDGPDTFRFSFIADVTGITRSGWMMAGLTMPFQDLDSRVVMVKCHGWSASGADIMSTPNKTVEKTSLKNTPYAGSISMTPPNGHKYLFKMESSEFEGNGSGEQFSSNGSGYSIDFDYRNSSGNLIDEFPEIFGNYATVALETIVKVEVYPNNTLSGFRLGIAHP